MPIPPRPHSGRDIREALRARPAGNPAIRYNRGMKENWFTYVYLAAGIGVLLLILRARRQNEGGGAAGLLPIACAIVIVVAFLVYLNSLAK
jgi:hypothetical protein